MQKKRTPIFSGQTQLNHTSHQVSGEFTELFGETYYKISNYNSMQPFFMSLVSSSNHWLFIASTGGLSAGRVNPDHALFPYYTEDKLTENFENTGSKTIFLVERADKSYLWEPFSNCQKGQYDISRSIYKNITGTALIFEEINADLEILFHYTWRTSEKFGFIKTSWIENFGDPCRVELLDGIQNILPAFATMQIQTNSSCLLDAYKRNELDPVSGLAVFALNATLTDLAEPSESLLATTVFQVGLDNPDILLSSTQLDQFRFGQGITSELEICGKRGAFFVGSELELSPGEGTAWHIVADVDQDFAQINNTKLMLQNEENHLGQAIESDIDQNTINLNKIVACSDGLQLSADKRATTHHFANVMFNVMRGGVFFDQYWVDKKYFFDYIQWHNKLLFNEQADFFSELPDKIHIYDLYERVEKHGNADIIRLSYTYLPLFFSRRHGDPSRPWNRFSINIKNSDGSDRLDYQGNWRDIFQNWEALAWSYPEFVEGMIYTFLNATTADGYNPYRITLEGIDWEVPEPDNPWANIGYWSDHQIIYLLKLMELSAKVHPGLLTKKLDQSVFSYANIPYRIKPFKDLIKDPFNSIRFDEELNKEIQADVEELGTDRKLLTDDQGNLIHRNLVEKLLTLLLAKLTNFVPEGGIWMNTQRPEWNDANNALVGKGLSVVTLGYLYRFNSFFIELLKNQSTTSFQISAEVAELFSNFTAIFDQYRPLLAGTFPDEERYQMLAALCTSGSNYRDDLYADGFSGDFLAITVKELLAFLMLIQRYIAHTLAANKRDDNLFHAYNVIRFGDERMGIQHLNMMLEGQVSILSSGFLTGKEARDLLINLRQSPLYTSEQNSYILYPDKDLPNFLERNNIPKEEIRDLQLPGLLVSNQDNSLFVKDKKGVFHFSGAIHNERDVQNALANLKENPDYEKLVAKEKNKIVTLFEKVFQHSEFTGRSSTFFAYEGLGSIYWHMVSKLLLAVEENVMTFEDTDLATNLREEYRDIRAGLGFNKSPEKFGAFPSDPYSHTPKGQGARQPGMTGLVKEEIIARLGELALTAEDGCLVFDPILFNREELLSKPGTFEYIDVSGSYKSFEVPENSMAYTFCQTPIVLQMGENTEIEVYSRDGQVKIVSGSHLDADTSRHIFERDGAIQKVIVKLISN